MKDDARAAGGEGEALARGEQTRQAILDAAKEVVARKGPGGAKIKDITEACGVNVAAVNYYFQSKDELVRLASQEITRVVNQARIERLDALETQAAGAALTPRAILEALILPVHDVARAQDGGSLYVRNVFQMRVDARAAYDGFRLNQHVAQRFIAAIALTFPHLTREQAIWRYELARGGAIHLLANMDPLSRRFELLATGEEHELPPTPHYQLDTVQIDRVIDTILEGFTG